MKLKDQGFECKDSETSRTGLEIAISNPKQHRFN